MRDLLSKRSENRATYEAIIFDLDGTIVDSNELHVAAWDEAFRHFGKHFSIDELRRQIGKDSDQYLPEFLSPDELRKLGKPIDEYRSALFRKKYLPQVKPFPKVRSLFERIRANGKRMALATSSHQDEVKTYTKLANIDGLFDCQTTADDADESKPAPDIFRAALSKLKISANRAITVGDTQFDVEAGKKIGLQTIGVLCGRAADEETFRKAGAIAVFKDLADLLTNYDTSPLAR